MNNKDLIIHKTIKIIEKMLIKVAVNKIINGIVRKFATVRDKIENLSENNNTERTFSACILIIKNIRPELFDSDVKALSFQLVIVMWRSFVRHDIILL